MGALHPGVESKIFTPILNPSISRRRSVRTGHKRASSPRYLGNRPTYVFELVRPGVPNDRPMRHWTAACTHRGPVLAGSRIDSPRRARKRDNPPLEGVAPVSHAGQRGNGQPRSPSSSCALNPLMHRTHMRARGATLRLCPQSRQGKVTASATPWLRALRRSRNEMFHRE